MLEEKFYTVADVAQVTGLTDRTIRNYLKDGTLMGSKIGVQWRFTEDEVRKLFMKQTPGNVSPAQLVKSFMSGEGSVERGIALFDFGVESQDKSELLYSRLVKKIQGDSLELTHEYRHEDGVLRVAASGDMDSLSAFFATVKKIKDEN